MKASAISAYEVLVSSVGRGVVADADKIISAGWSVGRYPPISVFGEMEWGCESDQQRSWNFYIHCWGMLDSLLKAYCGTSELKYLQPAVRVALDWAEKHAGPGQAGVSPFAWYDMAVGLRAYRLAYIVDAATVAGLLDDAQHALLWRSLWQHQRYLADDANIAFHSNHGFYQVAGQLAMGRRFADVSAEMAQAHAQGLARLRRMVEQQFAADGVHREHSPDYHRMVYDTLKALVDSGLVEDDDLRGFAARIERALSWFVLPDGHIANFGDSDYHSLSRKPSQARRKWSTLEMQYAVSGGKAGKPPDETYRAFTEGGYFIVRRPAPEGEGGFLHASYLAQNAAFHSRTHKHADDLSFIWTDRGSDLLVDAGRYGYIGKTTPLSELADAGYWYSDPNRIYCETTRAHNALELDGCDFPRKGAKPYGSALGRWLQSEGGIYAVEAACKPFKSVRYARVLIFHPARWLLVFDWFHDNTRKPHEVRQWFHLAPHLQLRTEGEGYCAPVPASPQPLRAVSLLAGPRPSRAFIGESEPVMQGWWSPKERDIVPNYAFCYEQAGVESGAFATLFSFSDRIEADIVWSKINRSGRNGQFRWKDEAGTHKLRLERPSDGEMTLAYEMR